MIINNHFHHRLMSTIDLLNKEFSTQDFAEEQPYTELLNSYKAIACNYARMENAIAVLSDLRTHTSHIYYGGFAQMLGTGLCGKESRVDSVWEEEIFRLIHPDDLVRKHLQELCFFHFIKRQPPRKRAEYYLMSKLRMRNDTNNHLPALHRMFYISTPPGNALWLALCLYSPLLLDIPAQGLIVHATDGQLMELDNENNTKILSAREKQVLSLIDKGLTSKDIAETLSISRNTVSRHRQEILGKLQVRNSIEACRIAKDLKLI